MMLTAVKIGFNFNLWEDIFWPIVTEFVWIPIIWYVYRRWTKNRKKVIMNNVTNFQKYVVKNYNDTKIDREATEYVNDRLVKFARFLNIIGNENINIVDSEIIKMENAESWNRVRRLNKFRQFFYYIYFIKKN